ncbi:MULTISPECIES: MarR family winged helix-turn-helix transcriptional regulator [unclassified Modestobacter]
MRDDLPDAGRPGLQLFESLVRLEIELWNAVDRRLRADHGVMLSWVELMRVIAAREGCRVQDIATDLSITVGGVSKLVDRMVAAGLCERVPHPTDRRSSHLDLTPAGADLLVGANASNEQELDRLLGGALDHAARLRLAGELAGLRAALRQAGSGVGAGPPD